MNNNFRIDMPNEVEAALNILNNKGFEAYIVGGCVRDCLLGIEPKDWDIATSALPSDIIECFKDFKVIETGIKHGTVAVIVNMLSIEVTTFRTEGKYTDNRRPDYVNFIDNIEMDLKRRDFTINAMAYSHKNGIIDFFSGIKDLKLKLIKCVGNPDDRFNEDGLRILRALRFASVLEFSIESTTSQSIHKNKELLKNISSERLSSEFNKLIMGKGFLPVMDRYRDVISVFIPEIKSIVGFKQRISDKERNLWLESIETVDCLPCDIILRLTALLYNIGSDREISCVNTVEAALNALRRLRYDNATSEDVKLLILYCNKEIPTDEISIKNCLNKIGSVNFKRLLEIKKAEAKLKISNNNICMKKIHQASSILNKILDKNICYNLKGLSVNGVDLINLGIKEGKRVGELLNELLALVIENELENEKELLISYVKKYRL